MSQWYVPFAKLGSEQIDAIKQAGSQNRLWIKGNAGSGKSVVLSHAVHQYKTNNPGNSVLVIVYTRALISVFDAAFREMNLRSVSVVTPYEYLRDNSDYDAIFCDEVQDLSQEVMNKLKNSRKLILSGDDAQSIYDFIPSQGPVVSTTELQSVGQNSFLLGILYRLTPSIQKLVSKVYKSYINSNPNRTKVDTEIEVLEASSIRDEVQTVWKQAKRANRGGDNKVAILLPSHNDIDIFVKEVFDIEGNSLSEIPQNRWGKPDYQSLNQKLTRANIPLVYLGNGYGEFSDVMSTGKIFIMTYHSSKGLDFDTTFVPLASDDANLYSSMASVLFLVALTRNKERLVISYTDCAHSSLLPYIRGMQIEKI